MEGVFDTCKLINTLLHKFLFPSQVLDQVFGLWVDPPLGCGLDVRQDKIWNGAVNFHAVEDPAHREVVAAMGSVEVAQVELFLEFDVAVGTIEAGSEREVLRSKSLLYNTENSLGHLEQLRSWNVAEGILLCRF